MPPPPNKPTKPAHGSKDPAEDDADPQSSNLWVGNLAADVTDSELMTLFGKYRSLDSISSYTSRNFAFVYFKRTEDAKAAKDALQGTLLHGNAIKIQFAKPAKPSKRLWVGGIGPSVLKEELEQEFLKFGKIDDFKFLRDRNTAFIDYSRLEDAYQALKSMTGKRLGGGQIRVDFLRSQPSRRENWPDHHDAKEGQFLSRSLGLPDSSWMPLDYSRNYPEPIHVGSKRQLHSQSSGGYKGDEEPSNILWVRYPPSVHIDEQMLHNAMILYGEIENIKCFPERHCSFVEFRSVDEAQLAREKLQGRLFNDPRILIMFSSSDFAPGKDSPGFYPGIKGPRPDIFFNELLYQPAQVDISSHNQTILPNSFPGSAPLHAVPAPHALARPPLGSQGSFEPLLPGPEYSDLLTLNKMQESNSKTLSAGSVWRRSPSAPGILSSPSSVIKASNKSVPGGWDVFDASLLNRESKRSRIDGGIPTYDASFPLKDDRFLGMDRLYGVGSHADEDSLGPLMNVQGKICRSPVGGRITFDGAGQGHLDQGYIWRGIIAKGGTPVCHARCIPIGEGIKSEIPEVVNCSARTGLDLLTKHYADAVGFSIVFFLPDSEEDFASYTEFLRYLGAKNRAGVAKFDDGTTLFLVPPSDFLADVLNVSGPERLYGVVLKFPQHALSSTSMPLQLLPPQHMDRQQIPPPRPNYGIVSLEEKARQGEFNRFSHEDPKHPLKQGLPQTSESFPTYSSPPITTSVGSQAGVTLTPELIATLASLLPSTGKASDLESAQPSSNTTILRPLSNPATVSDQVRQAEWSHEHRIPEQTGPSMQQVGSHFNAKGQFFPQLQAYPTPSNAPSHSAGSGGTQIQDPTPTISHQSAVSLQSTANFTSPQAGQLVQVDQHYAHGTPPDTSKGYGMAHVADTFGLYGSSVQQSKNSVVFPNQAHGSGISQPHSVLPTPTPAEQVISELPNQVQQVQSSLYGAGQGTSDVEVDKNLRYQSTLQFAANLLFQIQQQQQPPVTQAGQGSSNQ